MPNLPTIDLSNRIAVVTGSGWGIGKAIAHALAVSGAHVVVAELDEAAGRATVASIASEGGSSSYGSCDVANVESVKAMFAHIGERFGVIDILVNNAGIPGNPAPVDLFDDDDWERVISIDLGGVYRCTKCAVPFLERSSKGAIVNIASTFGMIGAPQTPAYAAAKGGVISLTKQLAVDLTPRGIRVNAVSPGYVDNDMARRGASMDAETAAARWQTRNDLAAMQPIGRQANTSEIANVVRFLVSDQASFMTGALVPVDGGCTATFNRGGIVQEQRH